MNKIILLFLVGVFTLGCVGQIKAQSEWTVTDSTISHWWNQYPSSRTFLKEFFPVKFKIAELDTVLFEGWKVYKANQGEEYYLALKIGGNWGAIVDLGSQRQNYVKGFINGDSLLIISPSIGQSGQVPQKIQDLIDKITN